MKLSIILLAILLGSSCERPESRKSLNIGKSLEDKKTEWDKYQSELKGDYQIEYSRFKGNQKTITKEFSEIRNFKLDIHTEAEDAALSVESMYEQASDLLSRSECRLNINFHGKYPIISELESNCGKGLSGIKVINFHKGFPINIQEKIELNRKPTFEIVYNSLDIVEKNVSQGEKFYSFEKSITGLTCTKVKPIETNEKSTYQCKLNAENLDQAALYNVLDSSEKNVSLEGKNILSLEKFTPGVTCRKHTPIKAESNSEYECKLSKDLNWKKSN